MLGSHEQEIATLEHHMTTNNLALQTRPPVPAPPPATEAATADASSAPRESYACHPGPFDGEVDKRWGFSQRLHLFASDEAKINYVIGLLRGKALAWAQAFSVHMHLNMFDQLVKRFERIFDWPNHSCCTSDRLFTLQQGNHSVAAYDVE